VDIYECAKEFCEGRANSPHFNTIVNYWLNVLIEMARAGLIVVPDDPMMPDQSLA